MPVTWPRGLALIKTGLADGITDASYNAERAAFGVYPMKAGKSDPAKTPRMARLWRAICDNSVNHRQPDRGSVTLLQVAIQFFKICLSPPDTGGFHNRLILLLKISNRFSGLLRQVWQLNRVEIGIGSLVSNRQFGSFWRAFEGGVRGWRCNSSLPAHQLKSDCLSSYPL